MTNPMPETFYHYCSTSTFEKIVTSKSVRLSSMSLSNDYMEGKLATAVMLSVIATGQLPDQHMEQIKGWLDSVESQVDGLAFCLSEDGDLLSQWRGYANDGNGVAIGFSSNYLSRLSSALKAEHKPAFSIQKVMYEKTEHDTAFQPVLDKLAEQIKAGAFGDARAVGLHLPSEAERIELIRKSGLALGKLASNLAIHQAMNLYAIKSRAFKEEQEWRMLDLSIRGDGKACEFHPVPDKLIPFRPIELKKLGVPAITHVVLGPKHKTPVHVVENFLAAQGLSQVLISPSAATYR